MYGPEDPLFMPLHKFTRAPFQVKELKVQKTPFWEKFGNFSLYSLNFCPNFSSQASKFENFSSQDPSLRSKNQFACLTLRTQATHPYLGSWVPYPRIQPQRKGEASFWMSAALAAPKRLLEVFTGVQGLSPWHGLQGSIAPCLGKFCISELNLHNLVHTFCQHFSNNRSWAISNKKCQIFIFLPRVETRGIIEARDSAPVTETKSM